MACVRTILRLPIALSDYTSHACCIIVRNYVAKIIRDVGLTLKPDVR